MSCSQEQRCPHYLSSEFQIKSCGDDGHFEGYASVFADVDQGADSVAHGAFQKSIKERGASGVKLLWQHDPKEIIGEILELHEDDHGLYVKACLDLHIARAREALSLMRIGALDGLSIGFVARTSKRDEHKNIRYLLDIDLWEISLVTFPMQPKARITSWGAHTIKSIRGFEQFLRETGGFSRRHAKAIASNGFRTFAHLDGSERDAHDDWDAILQSIETMENQIKSLI